MDARVLSTLTFESFAIDHLVDHRKRYHLALDPAFPFTIKLFSYDGVPGPFPMNWHERLELFVPLAGSGEFAIGEDHIPFEAGDVLVIDNLKLHGLASFTGPARRAMVVTFLPEFLYTLGSPLCDSLFLTPFYRSPGTPPATVKTADRSAPLLHEALSRLVQCYFGAADGAQYQAGCKAYLLEALYLLIARVGWTASTQSEYLRRQEQSRQLGKLHDYLLEHFHERVTVQKAASLVGMGESRFMKYFRSVTGETFVGYLNRLRVEKAAQLLEETGLSIAEIAAASGFADQSYFDKVFRRRFQITPREARSRAEQERKRVVALDRRR